MADGPEKKSVIKPAFLMLMLMFIMAFTFYGGRSLRETSEARYGEVAREMLATGNWLVPHLHGEPHLTKPPLAYWIMATGMEIGGVNEWGARLALPFAFLITLGCLYSIARSMRFTREEAYSACLIFATSGFGFIGSFVLTSDPFLLAAVAAGIAAFWRHRQTGSGTSIVFFWILFGLAFLIKGPPAWLHLFPVILLCLLQLKWSKVRPLHLLSGFALMLFIAFSWFLWMVIHDAKLLHYYLVDEIVNRVTTTDHGRNNSPLIYFAVLIAGVFPWVFLIPEALRRIKNLGLIKSFYGGEDWEVFTFAWLLFPLLVFLLAKSRMPLYVLPLMLPISLRLGKLLPSWLPAIRSFSPGRKRLITIMATCWILLLFGVRAMPDMINVNRAYKGDALELFPVVATIPAQHPFYYILARPKHGLDFYLNRTIEDPGLKHPKDIQEFLTDAENKDDIVFVIRLEDMEELQESGAQFNILGESERIGLLSGVSFP